MRKFVHKKLSMQRWFQLSLPEQLAHIGSEVCRTKNWQEKDEDIFQGAVERALELFDLTLEDARWRGRLREIARAREVFCDAVSGAKDYQTSLKDLERYFMPFTFLARRGH